MIKVEPAVAIGAAPETADKALRRAIVSCGIGQIFEIYDFMIYGLMAASLAQAFFPSSDPVAGLLSTFATFAVGFVLRPVGAALIGVYGDRYGRRSALVLTIGLMAVATGVIGLIPSYAVVGLAAPVILTLCRMVQGFSTGGEWGGSAAFLIEYAPDARRGVIGSYQQAASGIGLLAATLIAYLLSSMMDGPSFRSWGWRVPFLLGLVLGPIGYYLRTHVHETPAFKQSTVDHNLSRSPLRVIFSNYLGALLAGTGACVIGTVITYVFLIFMPSFASQKLGIPSSSTFLSSLSYGLIYLLLTPVMGKLSDRIGRKPMFYFTSAGAALLAYPLFVLLVNVHSTFGLFLTQAIAAVLLTGYTGAIVAMLAEMFPTSIRYTAISLCYGIAVSVFGGLAPLISTALVKFTGNSIAPAYYVIFAGVLSLISTIFVNEGAGLPLPQE